MHKWIITPPGMPNLDKLSAEDETDLFEKLKAQNLEEEIKWNKNYTSHEYQDVWSITDDVEVCKTLTKPINSHTRKILIPGCGSKTNLQKYIIENYPDINEIYCTDYSGSALEQARSSFSNTKVIYKKEDTSHLSFFDNHFDVVIISNSILSENDFLNRRMLRECYRVLKKGGILCGLFPSIFVPYEMALLDKRFSHFITECWILPVTHFMNQPKI